MDNVLMGTELDILGLTKDFEPDVSFYKKSNAIPIGTKEPYSSYNWEDMNESEVEDAMYWYEIDESRVLNWVLISRAGTHKTWMLKRLMTYFYYHNYNICCFDAKGASLASAKYLGSNLRLHPKEAPSQLPTRGYLPSFVSSQNYGAMSLNPKTVLGFDEHFTLNFKEISTLDEWITLLGATESGANVLVDALQKGNFNNFNGLLRWVQKRSSKLHPAVIKSLNNRLTTFIHNEVFNVIRQVIMKDSKNTPIRSINNKYLNLSSIWRKKIIPVICFYMADTRYMKVVVNNILNQQWQINRDLEEDKKKNILNIFDDAQFYFNKDDTNVAGKNASKTIDLGRTNRFNGVYIVQNPSQFHYPIIDGCKDKFISDLDDPGELARIYGRDVVDLVRQLETKSEPKSYDYAWIHIPAAKRYAKIFYPLGSPVYHSLSG